MALRLAASSGLTPSRILRTGTSIFLPVRVAGIAGTSMILSGTYRYGIRIGTAEIYAALESVPERVRDLRDGFERGVDLRGADADAVPVQRGIAAAEHEAAAALVDPEEVALPPHT